MAENHYFRFTCPHLSILRLVGLCCTSVIRPVVFAQPYEASCIPGSRFPCDGLAHHQPTLDCDYVLEPEGWEGYLETWSKPFVVSLACNSNKCTPSALSCIERTSFVGSRQLMNGLCSKICLWSVVRNAEPNSHSNKVTKESGRSQ